MDDGRDVATPMGPNPDYNPEAVIARLREKLAGMERERDEAHQVIDESHRMIVDEDTGRRWKELFREAEEQIAKLQEQRRVGAEAVRELFGIADIVNSFPEAPRSDGHDGALGRRVEGLIEEQRGQLAKAHWLKERAEQQVAEAQRVRQNLEYEHNEVLEELDNATTVLTVYRSALEPFACMFRWTNLPASDDDAQVFWRKHWLTGERMKLTTEHFRLAALAFYHGGVLPSMPDGEEQLAAAMAEEMLRYKRVQAMQAALDEFEKEEPQD